MPQTVFGTNDPKTVKRWSADLAVDVAKKSYFERRFIGMDDNSVVQKKTELESEAGDKVSFDLAVQLRQKPTYGDNRLEGKEENQRFFTDECSIDQVRHAVSAGGRMTRKRISHNLRTQGKARLAEYFAKLLDEYLFIYLAGARGINADFIEDLAFAGFAGNALQAPDANHIMYGGTATSKATVTSSDKMTRALVERATPKVEMMQAVDPTSANMVPVDIDEEGHFVIVMSPWQEHDLRLESGTGGWLDIQKAFAAADGAKRSPISRGGLGMINNTVLHKHRNVIRFSDYGSGVNLPAARAMLMGRQAAMIAYGAPTNGGGMRYLWEEKVKDYGNEPTVASGFILGIKKTRFNSQDFGITAIDTYSINPNS